MNKQALFSLIWWGIGLGLITGCALSDFAGFDYYVTFLPQGLKMDPSAVRNPMWVYLIISPITRLPVRLGFFVFSLINLIALHFACKLSGVNRFAVLLSFPSLWTFWYGQLDIFVALGIVLGAWSIKNNRPTPTGVSILLILIKPHIGIPISIAYFLMYSLSVYGEGRGGAGATVGILTPILIITTLTLIIWGWHWPIDWIINCTKATGTDQWFLSQNTNIGLYPYGLIAWAGILIPMPRRQRITYIIAATIASMPYIGVYSLLSLLILNPSWPVFILASTPIFLGQHGYTIAAFAAPFTIVYLLYKYKPLRIRRGFEFMLLPPVLRGD